MAAVAGVQAESPGAGGTNVVQEVVRLQRQVGYLSEALAKARAENDTLKARLDRREFDGASGALEDVLPGGTGPQGKEYRVLDVNKDLGLAVLNAGRRQGVRPGLRFAVLQNDKTVAMVRVVDVRANIAGAVVQGASVWSFPRAQDRAVMVTDTGE